MDVPTLLIVGAGPTGLTMAVEMKRAGMPVRLIDKSSHAAKYSQALVVQSRTLEQFERYGIADSAVAQGRKLLHAAFVSEGKTIARIDLSRIRSRYPFVLFYPQNETERLLTDLLQSLGGEVERNVELVSLKNAGGGVDVQLRKSDGSIENTSARWVAGCDGAHSTVRAAMGVPFEGDSVGLSFFLGDLEIEGPETPGDELRIHVHHGDVVFIGRLSETLYRVIVALHTEQGLPMQQSLTLADFQNAIDRAGVKVTAKSASWMTPFHVNDRQAKQYRKQNIFLAGDAAHIHSPVGGQGMNTGIQDSANLAWKLAAVARGAGEALLDSYDEERGAVGRALLRSTSRGLSLATNTNPVIEKIRDILAPLATKFDFVQDAAVGFISETAIDYRDSSIVTELGGDGTLRAGDRMPDAELKDGKHLVLSLGGPGDAGLRARFPRANVRNVGVSGVFGAKAKLIVVRPDGYIGYRGPHEGEKLDVYIRGEALHAIG